jgi:methionyl-tRNA synthetase
MMHAGTWMMEGYGRGDRGGVWSNHMGGDFDMFGPMSLLTISIFSVLFFLALLWTIAIKGYALWHAAKRGEKWWFIALLVINTFGILEVVYLVFFAKLWPRKGDRGNNNVPEKTQEKAQEKHQGHSATDSHTHANNHQA